MRRFVILSLILVVGIAALGGIRFAGDGHWGPERTQVATTQSGETVVIANNGWHGPPIGLFLIPLLMFGLFWALAGRRGGSGCGMSRIDDGERSRLWSDWHRAEHERMAASGQTQPSPPRAQGNP